MAPWGKLMKPPLPLLPWLGLPSAGASPLATGSLQLSVVTVGAGVGRGLGAAELEGEEIAVAVAADLGWDPGPLQAASQMSAARTRAGRRVRRV
jgi:hypothetical protein